MPRFRLDTQYAYELVANNSYESDSQQQLRMRCMDGDYKSVRTLAPIPFPGGDFGEIAVIYASAQSFGFEINAGKCVEVVLGLIGGETNFSFYESPNNVLHEYLPFVDRLQFPDTVKDELLSTITSLSPYSSASHRKPYYATESALIRVKGDFGLFPQYDIQTDTGHIHTSVYIHQQTLLNNRHKELAVRLLDAKAVTLYGDVDDEYLYEALSETSDYCIYYFLEDELKQIPLFSATISEKGVEVDEFE